MTVHGLTQPSNFIDGRAAISASGGRTWLFGLGEWRYGSIFESGRVLCPDACDIFLWCEAAERL